MISASIVLYNTKTEDLNTAVSSYQPSENRRLFLVDNSENECEAGKKIAAESRWIDYIRNEKNVGYGSAHNIGIRRAIEIDADYHIVLNPDLQFKPEILDELIGYADKHEDVVYMLPKVIYPDGELQYLCKLLPTPFDLIFRRFLPSIGPIKKMNERYVLKDTEYEKIMNPPCLSGCFMFMRTKALEEGDLLFDESFFMYCEDFDLMRRLHRVGKTLYYPLVQIIHSHKRDSYKNLKMFFAHMKSACIYFNKYGWFFDRERKRENKKILIETNILKK